MGKWATYLIPAFLIFLFAVGYPRPAAAQFGECPDSHQPVGPIDGSTEGTVGCIEPDDMDTWFNGIPDPAIACGGGLVHLPSYASVDYPSFVLGIPEYFTQDGLMQVWFTISFVFGEFYSPYEVSYPLEVLSYDASGNLAGYALTDTSGGLVTDIGYYPRIGVTLVGAVNGYFEIRIPVTDINLAFTLWGGRIGFSNFSIIPDGWTPAPLCDLPWGSTPTPLPSNTPTSTPTGTLPPTNTPTNTIPPTFTPTGTPPTSTPTNTPTRTPWPTGTRPPGTATPRPTSTPRTLPTVPRANTPTAIPMVTIDSPNLPTLESPNYPEIDVPGITYPEYEFTGTQVITDFTQSPIFSTTLATRTAYVSETTYIITEWQSATVGNLAWIQGEGITGTSPISMATEIGEGVSQPIVMAKALQVYAENLWPYIFIILLLLGWIIVNLLAKYGLALFSVVFKVVDTFIRWFIPFMGVLALLLLSAPPAHAQATPTPTPPPFTAFDASPDMNLNPLTASNSGLPGPLPIPEPNEEVAEITAELWDIDNLRGMVQMYQTALVFIRQNYVFSVMLIMFAFISVLVWIVGFIRTRGENV